MQNDNSIKITRVTVSFDKQECFRALLAVLNSIIFQLALVKQEIIHKFKNLEVYDSHSQLIIPPNKHGLLHSGNYSNSKLLLMIRLHSFFFDYTLSKLSPLTKCHSDSFGYKKIMNRKFFQLNEKTLFRDNFF